MRSDIARYGLLFVAIHWILVLTSLVLLGLGWYIHYLPPIDEDRGFLLDLHMSLGLTAAALILVRFFLWIAFKPRAVPIEFPRWRKLLSSVLYPLIYTSIVLMVISGYIEAVLSAATVRFWGMPLPAWDVADVTLAELLGRSWDASLRDWGAADVTLAEFLGTTHGVVALVLAGLVLAQVWIVALNAFGRAGIATPRPVLEETTPTASKAAQKLANGMHLFGWIEFWLQFVIAFLSALLLEFAATGQALSPPSARFGDAIDWGAGGLALLCIACLLDFYCTRVAGKIVLAPDYYLSNENKTAFWFLGAGTLIGTLGVLVSFAGVALSVSLLIAKTVSQPPGIAITDPSKIIRALDVFILLLNFILLLAHFIGVGVSSRLRLHASKARLKYMATRG